MKKDTPNLPQIFNFNHHQIRATMDKNNNPLFVAKDERSMLNIGLKGKVNMINESGLYCLINGVAYPML